MTQAARDKTLRVAIVGCGAIAEWHWNAIQAGAPRTRVSACVDPDPARAQALAAKTDGAAYATLAEALRADAADAVALMVPHHLHEGLALEAFAAGRHVLLEKPMATEPAACARILAAARAAGTVFMLAENAQYWPGVLRAKQLLDDGAIGALRTARAWCCTPFMPQFYAADGWRFSAAAAGGGVAMDVGSHFLRPLRMWCGELTEVVAATMRPDHMQVETLCRALCRFESGLVASFDALLAVAAGATVPRFQLTGASGEIVIDAVDVRLYPASGGAGEVVGKSDYLGSYAAEWGNFEACVLDGAAPAASPEYSLGELRAALAMYRSAASGRWERVFD
ncbi:MAG: Gfo/Idh/MocA family oxidoreductase [Deltaproteobacteria bacterium]|nr:Gfo/Idh/MocA family oxidoreductase [Deltaproteobacteria bacterium]